MSLDTVQKPVNGLETPHQDPPATSATEDVQRKNEGTDAQSSLNNSAKETKDVTNGGADSEPISSGQPLDAVKPKEPVEPTKPFQPEAPLPKSSAEGTSSSTEVKNNGVSAAQDTSMDEGAKSAEKMDVDSSENKLPISDPTTIGDVPTKNSEGQEVDKAKAKEFASVQETTKHGHDDDQATLEDQPAAKKQRTNSDKDSNGADSAEAPKRSLSRKKKEPKKAMTEDGQPRRSSRLAT